MRSLAGALCLGMALAGAQAAQADSEGGTGKLVAVELNTSGSDVYALQEAKIVVDEGGGVRTEYRLGGASLCPPYPVTELQIDALVRAAAYPKLRIKPFYKLGNGNSRCLVSFLLGSQKALADVQQ